MHLFPKLRFITVSRSPRWDSLDTGSATDSCRDYSLKNFLRKKKGRRWATAWGQAKEGCGYWYQLNPWGCLECESYQSWSHVSVSHWLWDGYNCMTSWRSDFPLPDNSSPGKEVSMHHLLLAPTAPRQKVQQARKGDPDKTSTAPTMV